MDDNGIPDAYKIDSPVITRGNIFNTSEYTDVHCTKLIVGTGILYSTYTLSEQVTTSDAILSG